MLMRLLPAIALAVLATACAKREPPSKDYARELEPGRLALREADMAQLPPIRTTTDGRAELQRAIAHSLAWLKLPSAERAYATDVAGLSRQDVIGGLRLLDELLRSHPDDASLDREVRARFRLYQSVGWDDAGSVLFTAYYTPIFAGSRTRTAEFRFPLYRKPADLAPNPNPGQARTEPARRLSTGQPYPPAGELLDSGELAGSELIWLRDPWEAYVVQVQGSAVIRTAEGMVMVGYAGDTGHPYVSVGKELIRDGKIPAGVITMPILMAHFRAHPEDVAPYVRRNPRFVFFEENRTGAPRGSIGVPVTADVSLATDKRIFPPGALAFSDLPGLSGFRVDQDTGGGIRAPGRADLYLGVGEEAERRAGLVNAEGRLFYLVPR